MAKYGGRHAASAVTEPMQAVRPTAPPIDPEPETATFPRLSAADLAEWDRQRAAMTEEEWMEPLRSGGARVERSMRQTMRERGLLLVNRLSAHTRQFRTAIWKGERA